MSNKNLIKYSALTIILAAIVLAGIMLLKKTDKSDKPVKSENISISGTYTNSSDKDLPGSSGVIKEAKAMPVYGNWRNFTTKDGLLFRSCLFCTYRSETACLLALMRVLQSIQGGNGVTYTTNDGLAHNGVVSIDYSKLTGDIWIGTLGGLNRWSSGKFETFNQFNSGMPNDLVYCVYCDGKDVWVATGGGAGHYDTYTRKWDIFTEQNAPMHEPWTYGVSTGDGKAFIAAWGGGVIEYNMKTRHFRDYVDPDGFMEIDLQPDDGIVHDITTATAYADSILWVSTYFGMSRYDGKNWKGYFDHDSGLASNFINFLRAEGRKVFVCCDNGLSSTDGTTWVTYKKDDNSENGKAIITNGTEKKEIPLSPSISHNFIIGVDADENYLWVATSKGVSRGELMK